MALGLYRLTHQSKWRFGGMPPVRSRRPPRAEAIKFVNFRESRIIAFNLDRTKHHYQSRRHAVTGNSPDDEISDYSLS